MRVMYATALALLATAAAALAAPPDVPETIQAQPGQLVRIVVKTPKDKDGKSLPIGHFRNFKDDAAFWGELVSPVAGERHFVYQAPAKAPSKAVRGASGERTVSHVIGFFTQTEDTGNMTTVTVTYPADVPVPVPPAPSPPKPVDPPAPPAAEAPIPGEGLRVLLVYDRDKITALPEAQKAVIYGADVQGYLRATCPKGADGVTPEARFWPIDTDVSEAPKLWQDAFNRAKTKANGAPLWLLVSNGKTGYEGAPPGTPPAALDLFKRYAP